MSIKSAFTSWLVPQIPIWNAVPVSVRALLAAPARAAHAAVMVATLAPVAMIGAVRMM